jgi:hypothetical protein
VREISDALPRVSHIDSRTARQGTELVGLDGNLLSDGSIPSSANGSRE